jgi:fumarylpyruvate hydrolase
MMKLAVEIAERTTIPVEGSDTVFPINRVFCVGRNYAAHAREMGANPDAEPPFFFAKPGDAVITGATCDMPYPSRTKELHHEVELVVGLKSGGRGIPASQALDCVYGIALGLDFTRRDMQGEAKKAGKPWDMSKGFDGSAVVGSMIPATGNAVPSKGELALSVNGAPRQKGDLSDMIRSIPEVIAELSTYLTLRPGDIIFTGTPEGVSPVTPGDKMEGTLAGVPSLNVTVVEG